MKILLIDTRNYLILGETDNREIAESIVLRFPNVVKREYQGQEDFYEIVNMENLKLYHLTLSKKGIDIMLDDEISLFDHDKKYNIIRMIEDG